MRGILPPLRKRISSCQIKEPAHLHTQCLVAWIQFYSPRRKQKSQGGCLSKKLSREVEKAEENTKNLQKQIVVVLNTKKALEIEC